MFGINFLYCFLSFKKKTKQDIATLKFRVSSLPLFLKHGIYVQYMVITPNCLTLQPYSIAFLVNLLKKKSKVHSLLLLFCSHFPVNYHIIFV